MIVNPNGQKPAAPADPAIPKKKVVKGIRK